MRAIPWKQIKKSDKVLGLLSTYYSNKNAKLPVRDVQKPWDQKSDPNIETMTYGLFSTCMPPGRRIIVDRGDSYLFFLTSWKNGRIITGYYELGWYIDTGLTARNSKRPWNFPDYALKAKRVHFVRNGVKLNGTTFSPIGEKVGLGNTIKGFGPRNFVRLNEKQTLSIKNALDKEPDITKEYVEEIRRLEEENKEKTGYKYPVWKLEDFKFEDGFTEKLFPEFLNLE